MAIMMTLFMKMKMMMEMMLMKKMCDEQHHVLCTHSALQKLFASATKSPTYKNTQVSSQHNIKVI